MPINGASRAAETYVRRSRTGNTLAEGEALPVLRLGALGAPVRELQSALRSSGFDPGPVDGVFGTRTKNAVRRFQAARGLTADGVAGPQTWSALGRSSPSTPAVDAPASGTRTYRARGTAYFPHNSRMEGGYFDRRGRPLHTLQDYLAGRAPYVSVAMDSRAHPYGTPLRIPELEAKCGRRIDFRVVDTGGAFQGKGNSRIDICVENRAASYDRTINGPLTLVFGPRTR